MKRDQMLENEKQMTLTKSDKAGGFSKQVLTKETKRVPKSLEDKISEHVQKVLARHVKLFALRSRFYERVLRLPDTDKDKSNFFHKLKAAQASAKEEIEIADKLSKLMGKKQTETSENVWGVLLEHVKGVERRLEGKRGARQDGVGEQAVQ